MDNSDNRAEGNKWKDRIKNIIILISVFLFLFISGTITSGFHFVDDHEVIKIKSELKNSSLYQVTGNWVKEDLDNNARFRPLYYMHRIFETKLFGSNFVAWSLYTALLCCLTLIIFLISLRRMNFSFEESMLFLIITFIGPQCSVWWRLGPGESLGMFLLACSFYFMSTRVKRNNYVLKNILFILFLILASLAKESFLLTIPAMVVLKIWYEKEILWYSFSKSTIKNLILIIPLMIVAGELLFIKYYVGTGYSGFDGNVFKNIPDVANTFFRFIKTYLNLLIAFVILFVVYRIKNKRFFTIRLFPFLFFLLVAGPNLILYAKTGLFERYLLPASLGLGFMVILITRQIENNPNWFKRFTFIVILVSFIPYMITSFLDARDFTYEGNETGRLLTAISSNHNGQILVVVDPVDHYEKSVSLKTYLLYEYNIDLYGYCVGDEIADDQSYIEGWKSYFTGRLFENLTSEPGLLVFLDKNMIGEFFLKSTLDQSDYSTVDIGESGFGLLKKTSIDE